MIRVGEKGILDIRNPVVDEEFILEIFISCNVQAWFPLF